MEYSQNRSELWIRIYDNVDSFNIITTDKIKRLIDVKLPEICDMSPTGWKPTKTNPNNYSLWIPDNRLDEDDFESFKTWAETANKHIWLGLNRNINRSFKGTELDYCVAADWNYNFEKEARTLIGEAEYQLKYQYSMGKMTKANASVYANTVCNALSEVASLLPLNGRFLVTTIPSIKADQTKLSWNLAQFISKNIGAGLLNATLRKEKPKTKELSISKKIEVWNNIFNDPTLVVLSENVNGRDIIIVDDLYQSGASMWSYARYLKSIGASKVIGIVAVKSLSDNDNK